jgi:release factor glutamine methyltransferase
MDAAKLMDVPWRDALLVGVQFLKPTEGEGAVTDVRRLLAHAMGAEWLELIKDPARRLLKVEAETLSKLLARRALGEPVARIVGERGFYGRDFLVTPATLDPRPESETLIDAALARVKQCWGRGAGLEILDIGTGTGCLLLTLLAELPEARGVGVDPSTEALAVAQVNADRLDLGGRATWVEGRFEVCAAGLDRRFQLIVSNPPYIATAEIAGLDRDVRDFDPHLALDGGADGLVVYRSIARHLDLVAAPGWVLCEIGATQAFEVVDLMLKSDVGKMIGRRETLLDMAGKPRCVAFEILVERSRKSAQKSELGISGAKRYSIPN